MTFQQQIQQAHAKLFNVALSFPETYLQAQQELIGRLLEKGVSSCEAQTAMQQLHNEWEPNLPGLAQKVHRLALEKI